MDWTNSGELLAVAGKVREIANKADHTIRYINVIHFYDENGQLLYRSKIPSEMVIFVEYRRLLLMTILKSISFEMSDNLGKFNDFSIQLHPLHGVTMTSAYSLQQETIFMWAGSPQT